MYDEPYGTKNISVIDYGGSVFNFSAGMHLLAGEFMKCLYL
jgi:hypothetical protein